MDLSVVEEAGTRAVEGVPDQRFMSRVDDASRIVEACLSNRTRSALLYAHNLTAAFFDLSSGEAGAILQKLRNYRVRLAVVCPQGTVRFSSRFGEMLAEERRGSFFGVFETRSAARQWLGEAPADRAPAVHVRNAVDADLEAVARVYARTVVASSYYDEAEDEDAECHPFHARLVGYVARTHHPRHALQARTLIVAERNRQIVGFTAGHRSTRLGCSAELEWMFVLPEDQRRGVGGALLQHLTRWFVEQQSTKVIVDAPPANPCRAFYVKHGAIPLDQYWLYWPHIGQENA
jgi:GNAT superfamily N-acetyltransferase